MSSSKKEKFYGVNDELWGHKWGFKDSSFIINDDNSITFTGARYDGISGERLPYLIPFVTKVLDTDINKDPYFKEVKKKFVSERTLNKSFIEEIESSFEKDKLSIGDDERVLHSHGQNSPDEVFKVLYDKLEKFTDLIIYVETEEDVVLLINLAKKHNVCLVPYGGGTNVTNALQLPKNETRMIVTVDTRRLNRIISIDQKNLLVEVEAGITGKELENQLQDKGFTTGHQPDSIELSTVGGWISTNAAGMKKNRYGNIEDIVQNLVMVTPNGIINQIEPLVRSSIGIKTQNILFGSEGNLGIITKATMKIHRLPECSDYESVVMKDWDTGLDFMYELAHSNTIPASARMLDSLHYQFGSALKPEKTKFGKFKSKIQKLAFKIKNFDADHFVAAVFKLEGTFSEVEHQRKNIKRLARKYNGLLGGSKEGKVGYNITMVIAYIREFFVPQGILGETLETAVPWSKVNQVKDEANKLLTKLHKEYNLPGKPFFCSRVSKIYHTGVCMYNTMGINVRGVKNPEKVFSDIEHKIRACFIKNGGSISHHHGVGKLRKEFMPETISAGSIQVIQNIKKSQDPDNIFGIDNNIVNKIQD
ncbi:MAG: FAD-binding oxidoreductase [Candidatus Marinimicrobia bacterium]|jgi:alkyldihydroxyacetonephosphate synthase|nr:FAD-binding oxidoreductase [Candidatus Neomarinimicrobiota bacterium]